MNLYIFNPDNDLALANNNANYRSPASARKMALDLTPLMGWLARDGDCLLFPEQDFWRPAAPLYPHLNACFLPGLQKEFANDMKRWINRQQAPVMPRHTPAFPSPERHSSESLPDRFTNDITEKLYSQASLLAPQAVIPWGWNQSLIHQLKKAGLSPALLPSSRKMNDIRRISHRSLAVQLLRKIKEQASDRLKPWLCGTSKEIASEDELRTLIEKQTTELLLKAPVSGSGRGLIRASGKYAHPLSGWCRNTLQAQGSVIVEPYYNKVCDFAMEFSADGQGDIHFAGYSLFETNVHGSYTRNLLLPDESIETRICSYGFDTDMLGELQTLLKDLLPDMIPADYCGILGIDLMVCQEGERCLIHPCVELNARMTMGLFSRRFYDRYVRQGATGSFCIRFSKKEGELLRQATDAGRQHPPRIHEGRFVSGYLPLTPVTENTRFMAEINLHWLHK